MQVKSSKVKQMKKSENTPTRKSPFKINSTSKLFSATSPCQKVAKKLVRKYSLGSRQMGQKKELTNLRSSLPHMKHATDLELVLEAITYIQQLQRRVVTMSSNFQEKEKK